MPTRLCVVCHKRQPVVPDRERMGPIKRVCRECHLERLAGDVREIEAEMKRRGYPDAPAGPAKQEDTDG